MPFAARAPPRLHSRTHIRREHINRPHPCPAQCHMSRCHRLQLPPTAQTEALLDQLEVERKRNRAFEARLAVLEAAPLDPRRGAVSQIPCSKHGLSSKMMAPITSDVCSWRRRGWRCWSLGPIGRPGMVRPTMACAMLFTTLARHLACPLRVAA